MATKVENNFPYLELKIKELETNKANLEQEIGAITTLQKKIEFENKINLLSRDIDTLKNQKKELQSRKRVDTETTPVRKDKPGKQLPFSIALNGTDYYADYGDEKTTKEVLAESMAMVDGELIESAKHLRRKFGFATTGKGKEIDFSSEDAQKAIEKGYNKYYQKNQKSKEKKSVTIREFAKIYAEAQGEKMAAYNYKYDRQAIINWNEKSVDKLTPTEMKKYFGIDIKYPQKEKNIDVFDEVVKVAKSIRPGKTVSPLYKDVSKDEPNTLGSIGVLKLEILAELLGINVGTRHTGDSDTKTMQEIEERLAAGDPTLKNLSKLIENIVGQEITEDIWNKKKYRDGVKAQVKLILKDAEYLEKLRSKDFNPNERPKEVSTYLSGLLKSKKSSSSPSSKNIKSDKSNLITLYNSKNMSETNKKALSGESGAGDLLNKLSSNANGDRLSRYGKGGLSRGEFSDYTLGDSLSKFEKKILELGGEITWREEGNTLVGQVSWTDDLGEKRIEDVQIYLPDDQNLIQKGNTFLHNHLTMDKGGKMTTIADLLGKFLEASVRNLSSLDKLNKGGLQRSVNAALQGTSSTTLSKAQKEALEARATTTNSSDMLSKIKRIQGLSILDLSYYAEQVNKEAALNIANPSSDPNYLNDFTTAVLAYMTGTEEELRLLSQENKQLLNILDALSDDKGELAEAFINLRENGLMPDIATTKEEYLPKGQILLSGSRSILPMSLGNSFLDRGTAQSFNAKRRYENVEAYKKLSKSEKAKVTGRQANSEEYTTIQEGRRNWFTTEAAIRQGIDFNKAVEFEQYSGMQMMQEEFIKKIQELSELTGKQFLEEINGLDNLIDSIVMPQYVADRMELNNGNRVNTPNSDKATVKILPVSKEEWQAIFGNKAEFITEQNTKDRRFGARYSGRMNLFMREALNKEGDPTKLRSKSKFNKRLNLIKDTVANSPILSRIFEWDEELKQFKDRTDFTVLESNGLPAFVDKNGNPLFENGLGINDLLNEVELFGRVVLNDEKHYNELKGMYSQYITQMDRVTYEARNYGGGYSQEELANIDGTGRKAPAYEKKARGSLLADLGLQSKKWSLDPATTEKYLKSEQLRIDRDSKIRQEARQLLSNIDKSLAANLALSGKTLEDFNRIRIVKDVNKKGENDILLDDILTDITYENGIISKELFDQSVEAKIGEILKANGWGYDNTILEIQGIDRYNIDRSAIPYDFKKNIAATTGSSFIIPVAKPYKATGQSGEEGNYFSIMGGVTNSILKRLLKGEFDAVSYHDAINEIYDIGHDKDRALFDRINRSYTEATSFKNIQLSNLLQPGEIGVGEDTIRENLLVRPDADPELAAKFIERVIKDFKETSKISEDEKSKIKDSMSIEQYNEFVEDIITAWKNDLYDIYGETLRYPLVNSHNAVQTSRIKYAKAESHQMFVPAELAAIALGDYDIDAMRLGLVLFQDRSDAEGNTDISPADIHKALNEEVKYAEEVLKNYREKKAKIEKQSDKDSNQKKVAVPFNETAIDENTIKAYEDIIANVMSGIIGRFQKLNVGKFSNVSTNARNYFREQGLYSDKDTAAYADIISSFLQLLELEAISSKHVRERLEKNAAESGQDLEEYTTNQLNELYGLLIDGDLSGAFDKAKAIGVIDSSMNSSAFIETAASIKAYNPEWYEKNIGTSGTGNITEEIVKKSFSQFYKSVSGKDPETKRKNIAAVLKGWDTSRIKTPIQTLKYGAPLSNPMTSADDNVKYTGVDASEAIHNTISWARSINGEIYAGENSISSLIKGILSDEALAQEEFARKFTGTGPTASEKIGTLTHELNQYAIEYKKSSVQELFDYLTILASSQEDGAEKAAKALESLRELRNGLSLDQVQAAIRGSNSMIKDMNLRFTSGADFSEMTLAGHLGDMKVHGLSDYVNFGLGEDGKLNLSVVDFKQSSDMSPEKLAERLLQPQAYGEMVIGELRTELKEGKGRILDKIAEKLTNNDKEEAKRLAKEYVDNYLKGDAYIDTSILQNDAKTGNTRWVSRKTKSDSSALETLKILNDDNKKVDDDFKANIKNQILQESETTWTNEEYSKITKDFLKAYEKYISLVDKAAELLAKANLITDTESSEYEKALNKALEAIYKAVEAGEEIKNAENFLRGEDGKILFTEEQEKLYKLLSENSGLEDKTKKLETEYANARANKEYKKNLSEYKTLGSQYNTTSKTVMSLQAQDTKDMTVELKLGYEAQLEAALTRLATIKQQMVGTESTLKDLQQNYLISSEQTTSYELLKLKYAQELAIAQGAITAKMKSQQGFLQKLVGGFKNQITWFIDSSMAYAAVGRIRSSIRDLINTTKLLDAALVDIQIATGDTREETRNLMLSYNLMAAELGRTTQEVTTASNDWLRAGYKGQEAAELTRASMMLSTLGMIESTEATTYLISTLKGWKLAASDVIGVVDKLTAVDMSAAISAGDLALAMSRANNSARLAGVDMNNFIGYVTTVADISQKSAESVGESFKTIFSRFGNVKAGKFTASYDQMLSLDYDTGEWENLNDIETVLTKVGIKIRENANEWRNVDDIMTDIGEKWKTWDSVTQSAVATAVAGTRQRENVITLFENFDDVSKYADIAANSYGTASEKMKAYTDSVEASQKRFTNVIEGWALDLNQSETIKAFYDSLTFLTDNILSVTGVIALLIGVLNGLKLVNALTTMSSTISLKMMSLGEFYNVGKGKGKGSSIGENVRATMDQAYLQNLITHYGSLLEQNTSGLNLQQLIIAKSIQTEGLRLTAMEKDALTTFLSSTAEESVTNAAGQQALAKVLAAVTTDEVTKTELEEIAAGTSNTEAKDRNTFVLDQYTKMISDETTRENVLKNLEKSKKGSSLSATLGGFGAMLGGTLGGVIGKELTSSLSGPMQTLGMTLGGILGGFSLKALGSALPSLSKGLGAFASAVGGFGWIGLGVTVAAGIWAAIKKANEERLKKAAEEFLLASQKYTESKGATKLASELQELSKGVNSLGQNITLTEEEYASFIDKSNLLAEIFPELVLGVDAEGNSILKLSNTFIDGNGATISFTEYILNLVAELKKASNEKLLEPNLFADNMKKAQADYTKALTKNEAIDSVLNNFNEKSYNEMIQNSRRLTELALKSASSEGLTQEESDELNRLEKKTSSDTLNFYTNLAAAGIHVGTNDSWDDILNKINVQRNKNSNDMKSAQKQMSDEAMAIIENQEQWYSGLTEEQKRIISSVVGNGIPLFDENGAIDSVDRYKAEIEKVVGSLVNDEGTGIFDTNPEIVTNFITASTAETAKGVSDARRALLSELLKTFPNFDESNMELLLALGFTFDKDKIKDMNPEDAISYITDEQDVYLQTIDLIKKQYNSTYGKGRRRSYEDFYGDWRLDTLTQEENDQVYNWLNSNKVVAGKTSWDTILNLLNSANYGSGNGIYGAKAYNNYLVTNQEDVLKRVNDFYDKVKKTGQFSEEEIYSQFSDVPDFIREGIVSGATDIQEAFEKYGDSDKTSLVAEEAGTATGIAYGEAVKNSINSLAAEYGKEVFKGLDLGENGIADEWSEFASIIDKVSNSFTKLAEAQSELALSGSLSASTVVDLIEDNEKYLDLINFDLVSGSFKLKTNSQKTLLSIYNDGVIAQLEATRNKAQDDFNYYTDLISHEKNYLTADKLQYYNDLINKSQKRIDFSNTYISNIERYNSGGPLDSLKNSRLGIYQSLSDYKQYYGKSNKFKELSSGYINSLASGQVYSDSMLADLFKGYNLSDELLEQVKQAGAEISLAYASGATDVHMDNIAKDKIDELAKGFEESSLEKQMQLASSLAQNVFSNVDTGADGIIGEWGELADMLAKMADSYDKFKAALKEATSEGKLSWETTLGLLESNADYVNALEITEDGIKLKTDAERIMAEVQVEAAKANILAKMAELEAEKADLEAIINAGAGAAYIIETNDSEIEANRELVKSLDSVAEAHANAANEAMTYAYAQAEAAKATASVKTAEQTGQYDGYTPTEHEEFSKYQAKTTDFTAKSSRSDASNYKYDPSSGQFTYVGKQGFYTEEEVLAAILRNAEIGNRGYWDSTTHEWVAGAGLLGILEALMGDFDTLKANGYDYSTFDDLFNSPSGSGDALDKLKAALEAINKEYELMMSLKKGNSTISTTDAYMEELYYNRKKVIMEALAAKLLAMANAAGTGSKEYYDYMKEYLLTMLDIANLDDERILDRINLLDAQKKIGQELIDEKYNLIATADSLEEKYKYEQDYLDAVKEEQERVKSLLDYYLDINEARLKYISYGESGYSSIMSLSMNLLEDKLDLAAEEYSRRLAEAMVKYGSEEEALLHDSDVQDAMKDYIGAYEQYGELQKKQADDAIKSLQTQIDLLEKAKPKQWSSESDIKSYASQSIALYEQKLAKLKEALNDVSRMTDEDIEDLVDQYNAAYEEIHNLKIQALEDEKSLAEERYSAITDTVNLYIKDIEKQKEVMEEYYDDEIKKLQDKETSIERTNKLIELQNNLLNAQLEKERVYREGIGWTYETNRSKVKEAEKAISDFNLQDNIQDLQNAKEAEAQALQDSIDNWNEYLAMLEYQYQEYDRIENARTMRELLQVETDEEVYNRLSADMTTYINYQEAQWQAHNVSMENIYGNFTSIFETFLTNYESLLEKLDTLNREKLSQYLNPANYIGKNGIDIDVDGLSDKEDVYLDYEGLNDQYMSDAIELQGAGGYSSRLKGKDEGWITESDGKSWYATSDDTYYKNGWAQIGNKYYYFDENGYAVDTSTGAYSRNGISSSMWDEISGDLNNVSSNSQKNKLAWILKQADDSILDPYFADKNLSSGSANTKTQGAGNYGTTYGTTNGWVQEKGTGKWWYATSDSTYASNGWMQDSSTGKWYNFDSNGYVTDSTVNGVSDEAYRKLTDAAKSQSSTTKASTTATKKQTEVTRALTLATASTFSVTKEGLIQMKASDNTMTTVGNLLTDSNNQIIAANNLTVDSNGNLIDSNKNIIVSQEKLIAAMTAYSSSSSGGGGGYTSSGSGGGSSSSGSSGSSGYTSNYGGIDGAVRTGNTISFNKPVSQAVKDSVTGPGSADKLSVSSTSKYANGIENGPVSYTGLAMLHGTPSSPEYVLNSDQAYNLLRYMATSKPQFESTASQSCDTIYNFQGGITMNGVNDPEAFFSELTQAMSNRFNVTKNR